MAKTYKLRDSFNREYVSATPGKLGGNRRLKIYGKLDCPSAARALARGHYREYRVFFKDEKTARHAGYRPCGCCMKAKYAVWRKGSRKF